MAENESATETTRTHGSVGTALRSRAAFLARYGVLASMVAIFVAFCVMSPDAFFTWLTMKAILRDVTPLLILALGVTVVLVMSDFDLSVGGLTTLLGTFAIMLVSGAHAGLNVALAITITLLAGAAIGLFSGVVIAYARAESFIFTLAMGTLYVGVQLQITNSTTIYEEIPTRYTGIANGTTFGLSNVVYVGALVVVIIGVFLSRTETGRHMYAIGGNIEAARLSGIRTRELKALGYSIVGLCAGVAAVLITAQAGGANPNSATGLLLPAYAAAFLGSAMFRAGWFTALGTLFGALFLQIVGTGLSILNQPGPIVLIVQGAILASAVLVSRLSRQ